MKRSPGLLVGALAAAGAIGLAGCGGGGGGSVAAVRYPSAHQLIAALGHGGLPCTEAFYPRAPEAQGASSEASCRLKGIANQRIDVFPGKVTTKMVLDNSASSGTEQIWSDVGPNWWVETNKADAKLIQKAIGGRVIAGPWHPPSG